MSVGLGILGLYLDLGIFLVIGYLLLGTDRGGVYLWFRLGYLEGFLASRIILLENLLAIF